MNYVNTFDYICNCVNFVHVCLLSVILICNSNKLYDYRNKQTNKFSEQSMHPLPTTRVDNIMSTDDRQTDGQGEINILP